MNIYMYLYILLAVLINFIVTYLLGEDFISYFNFVSNPFDLIDKICSIHTYTY